MTETQAAAIAKHGRNLLAIFPHAKEKDPVALCKKLRRIEAEAERFALRGCNGPQWESEEAEEQAHGKILDKLDALINFRLARVPVFVNRDPRGYALKIDNVYVRDNDVVIHQDWGGYGIIAPEIDTNGN